MNPTPTLPRCPVCGWELEESMLSRAADGRVFCGRRFCGVELAPGEEGRVKAATFRLLNHYSLCVLPFSFAAQERADPFRRLCDSDRWKQRIFTLDKPEDVDRTEYFLPYIRRFLFPTLQEKAATNSQGAACSPATCEHWEFDLRRLGQEGNAGLPMTLSGRDTRKNLTFDYKLRLERAQLVTFSFRVGFLVLEFSAADRDATFFDQMNALVYLRAIAPLYTGFEMPYLVTAKTRFRTTQLLPYLLAELAPDGTLPSAPENVSPKTPLPVRPIYDDRMMVYAFSCIDKKTAIGNAEQGQKLLYRSTIVNFENDPTERPLNKEIDGEGDEEWLRVRYEGFSKDGGTLVVFNTDRFHERFIGIYQGTYYFDIFLLAALQRVTLLTLFERLSDIQGLTTGSAQSRKQLRRVRLDLLLFKNQCWFSQITNRERGLQLWKKWQEVFENKTLLEEVNEQSSELDTYLQNRMREKVEWLIRLGGFLAAAVPAVLGLDVLLKYDWVENLKWVLLVLLIVGTGIFAWYVLYRQQREDA